MFFEALGIGLLLIIIGIFSGAYSCLRRKGVPISTSFIICSFALYLTVTILLEVVNSHSEKKIVFVKKMSFCITAFPFAFDLTCDAIAAVLEKLMTTQPTVRVQCRSVKNRRKYIVSSAKNEMDSLQPA